jgi:YHS domain-containing protein
LSPLRIIILIILVYIAYRLIFSGRKSTEATKQKGWPQTSDGGLRDTLEEDPVCKKLVPSRQAVQLEWRGKKLYFCSRECCNIFRTNQGE